MELKMLFSQRLKTARSERGYTQERLGSLSGVSKQLIAKYEGGLVLPNIENLKKISSALEVCSDFFLYEHANMTGIPKVKDPTLYERYFILEDLSEDERKGLLTILDSLIARKEMRKLAGKYAS